MYENLTKKELIEYSERVDEVLISRHSEHIDSIELELEKFIDFVEKLSESDELYARSLVNHLYSLLAQKNEGFKELLSQMEEVN